VHFSWDVKRYGHVKEECGPALWIYSIWD
jgi:hypothetical protein